MTLKYGRGDVVVIKGRPEEPGHYLNEIIGKKVVIESIAFSDDDGEYIEYYSFFVEEDIESGVWFAFQEEVIGIEEKIELGPEYSGVSLTVQVSEDGSHSKITEVKYDQDESNDC